MPKSMTIVVCEACGKKFKRYSSEVKRSIKLGRKQFCGRKCQSTFTAKNLPDKNWDSDGSHISQFSGNRRDEYSDFRWYMKVVNQRKKDVDIDPQYLKEVWDNQEGVCPLSGFKLILRTHNNCRDTLRVDHASIDRVDNNKGYIKGNVRFVSVMANYARNKFSDEDLLDFCRAVTYNNK